MAKERKNEMAIKVELQTVKQVLEDTFRFSVLDEDAKKVADGIQAMLDAIEQSVQRTMATARAIIQKLTNIS